MCNSVRQKWGHTNIYVVSDVGQLITGPSDVGGQCPSPTNKYTSRFGKPISIYDKYLGI